MHNGVGRIGMVRVAAGLLVVGGVLLAGSAMADNPAAPPARVEATPAPSFDALVTRQGQLPLAPAVRTKLQLAARELVTRMGRPVVRGARAKGPLEHARDVAQSPVYAPLTSMTNGDVEALAFLVMMEASKSAQDDLAAIMAQTKAANNAKAKLRELLSDMKKRAASAKDVLASNKDSLGDMSEMDSMMLQQLMDRLVTLELALSNVLKKIADTQTTIIGNLK